MTKAEKQKLEELYLKQQTQYDDMIQYLSKLINTQETILTTYRQELDYYKGLATQEAINKIEK